MNSPSPRDSKRSYSAAVMTGAGHALVDRGDAPSSGLRRSRRRGPRSRRAAATARARRRSGRRATSRRPSRAATPRRPRRRRSRTGTLRARAAASSRRRPPACRLPASACLMMLRPSAIARHHPVLDAVVDHLHEVARRRSGRSAGSPRARSRPCACAPVSAPRVPTPGAIVLKIGSRRCDRPRPRRRSSGSSRARGPTRRRSCRSRRSGCLFGASCLARAMSSR